MPRVLLVFVGVLYDCYVSAMGISPNEGSASLNLTIAVMCLMSWARPKARYFIYMVRLCTRGADIFVDSSSALRAIITKTRFLDTVIVMVIGYPVKYGM